MGHRVLLGRDQGLASICRSFNFIQRIAMLQLVKFFTYNKMGFELLAKLSSYSEDILQNVIFYFDWNTLASASIVCKKWNLLVQKVILKKFFAGYYTYIIDK
jgi:hypothetical protein